MRSVLQRDFQCQIRAKPKQILPIRYLIRWDAQEDISSFLCPMPLSRIGWRLFGWQTWSVWESLGQSTVILTARPIWGFLFLWCVYFHLPFHAPMSGSVPFNWLNSSSLCPENPRYWGSQVRAAARLRGKGVLVSPQPFCLVSRWHHPPSPLGSPNSRPTYGACLVYDWAKGYFCFPRRRRFPVQEIPEPPSVSESVTQLPSINSNVKTLCATSHYRKEQSRPKRIPEGWSLVGEDETTTTQTPSAEQSWGLWCSRLGERSHVRPHCKSKPSKLKLALTVEINRGSLCLPWRIIVKGFHWRVREDRVSPRRDQSRGEPLECCPVSLASPQI